MGLVNFIWITVFCAFLCMDLCVANVGEASAYPYGALQINTQCTRKCTLLDDNLTGCWEQSLDYYTEQLAQAVSSYAGTLLFIHRWRQRNDPKKLQMNFETKALKNFLTKYNESVHDASAKGFRLDPVVLSNIFTQIAEASEAVYKKKYTDEMHILPNFACPTPCNYDYYLWTVLFFVMLAIFILSMLSFAAYYYTHRHHMNSWKTKDKRLMIDS